MKKLSITVLILILSLDSHAGETYLGAGLAFPLETYAAPGTVSYDMNFGHLYRIGDDWAAGFDALFRLLRV